MNDFLEYLRSIGKADSTVKAYTSDLYIFFVWVLQNADNKYFPEISKRDIISYQNWLLRNNENSPARVRRLKSTLSSLSNYIEAILDDELPNFRSIVRKIENPVNEPTREKTVLIRRTGRSTLGLSDGARAVRESLLLRFGAVFWTAQV